jgi:hypothetical protein
MRGKITAMKFVQGDFLSAAKPSVLSRLGTAARWVFAASSVYALDWYDMLVVLNGPQGGA